jgi:ADP-ribose pyrophosphatase YjhB (NUDIX family)
MRPLEFAYRIQRRLWRLLRPRTRGVKVMLFNRDGEVLLIRNSYGASNLYVLPGGGVRPWESVERAAHREIREELGCSIERLALVSTHFTSAEGKRDTVHLFEARLTGVPRADGREVADARFFSVQSLPEAISPATARRLAERSGQAVPDGSW